MTLMMMLWPWLVLTAFGVSTLALAAYGFHLYILLFLHGRKAPGARRRQRETIDRFWAASSAAEGSNDGQAPPSNVPREHSSGARALPMVTTQIPLYNERDVAERVIMAVAAFDYPHDRHEIQILDDSDDATRELIDRVALRLRAEGLDVRVVRRLNREGYKAGALQHGLAEARGQYIAIFDADFIPPEDFLKQAVPLLEADERLACLQGRWAHLNRDESWLTNAQSMGIDGHFAIEQGARAWNGLMMNFNGTAGVWRRAAIEDPAVGGWSGDTLTEDLDLSYRAQLAGWRLDYCRELACPAELPNNVAALKSQQRRWATGSMQVARKLLPRIWRSPATLGTKLEATLHLTHYSVALWMLILALVARPMLLVFADGWLSSRWFWAAWGFIIVSAAAPSMTYMYARYSLEGRWSGLRTVVAMVVLGCGMCVNNSLAVLRGLRSVGGEFVRTPKSGSAGRLARDSSYRAATDRMWMIEMLLGVYSLLSFLIYFQAAFRVFSIFLLFYAAGFCLIGWLSRPTDDGPTAPDFLSLGKMFRAKVAPAREGSGR